MNTKVLGILPLLGLSLLISCSKKQEEVKEDTTVKVKTTVAALQKVDQVSTYTANVEADVLNQITPAMGGRIEKIYVEIGSRVGKGQLLVQMESSNLQQQQTQLANLEKDYARLSELLAVGGVSQQQVDLLKTSIDALKIAIKNIQDNTQLRSPISGVITAKNYDNGDVFGQRPILTVEQLNPVKAQINVSEANFSRLKVGMPVTFTLDVYGEEEFTGKVGKIYPTIDPATHTFGVEIAINNPAQRVRPGMYARVTLNFGTTESIVVPDVAVQKQAGANDKYVYTIIDGKAHYQKVELGQRLDTNYEIISGITPGQVVVTAGQARLVESTPVQIIKE
jgi:RND family efflux transporter MFP subunit